ncbi:hypothetical protein TcWFU_003537 [Taenia crassiceps]|uniref:Desmoplakin SH3 domain-containing protein n=1 Tax=Taenia crassiceps TaxID=6207 RepID=A0ABR4QE00_9CEST
MSRGVSAIDRELVDYRIVASDLKVGVNHLALDEERIRQKQFFEGILDLQQRISQNPDYQGQYGDEVENLKNGIRLNADVLSYLKSITKLEVPLTDLTNKITQAAIDAGSPKAASPEVFANKALTENVNSCWEYIAQLSLITQSHLKDAASYQQFHHMANEVDAHIDKMIGLAEMKTALFDPQGIVDESTLLANELEADHVELARTWEQTCQLTDMARYMKPLRNRHCRVVSGRAVDSPEDVAQQIVMVKALIDFSGPDFAIRKGEEMILMNNENPNFWQVKTTFGEREVPSLIFATMGPNQNEVFKANSLQKKCISDWRRVLERTKGRLVKYYATLFGRYCQNEAVYFAHEDAMNAFLDDVDSILIAPNYDSGILHRAYDKFTNTLVLLSPNRRPPRGAVALTESDIRVLHTPLRLVLNQVAHVDQLQARVTMTADEVQRYLKSVENERLHIYNEIVRMEQLQKEKESQLKSLADRMVDWNSKRKAFDRAIRDYTSEPTDDILKHFPSTRLAKPNAIENDYRSPTDHYETDVYEPSNRFRNSGETPSSDYGQVAKQMVTSHTRSKPSGIKFAGGVFQERASSKVWAGNAMSLKRSASTNDLQTQILRVTISTSTQCNENAGVSESDAVYDTDKRRQTLLGSHGGSAARVKAELNAKRERYQGATDVQAQIIRVTKNASSQVGVRVMPKSIDLSCVDIDNLGLEVQNNSDTTGLGLRVGQVLCPVTVGTSMDLFEGPGVQVMGINDVDSINMQLRDSVAHATTDAHRRLKVRDVQAQIFSSFNSPATTLIREDLLNGTWARETMRPEVQAQVGIINKAVGVQAVAAMEVVNIPSQKPKKQIAEGATTSLCLLPGKDTKSMGFVTSEPSTSTVMTQISCLLHSRGIHSDLKSYLSEYKQRNGINSETSDLSTQVQHIGKHTNGEPHITGFVEASEIAHANLKSVDVETLICRVVHDAGTQVSSKLVPTEVTVGKITTKDMEVSFANPLRKVDICVPVDSLICPADMKFRSELYEGSSFQIADYSGLSEILVKHDGLVARGSVMPDEISVNREDLQTLTTSELRTQAAIVLRTDKTKSAVGEIVASAKYVPKLKLVVEEIASPSIHAPRTSTSDSQTQISDMTRPADGIKKSEDLDENAIESTRGYDTVEGDYSTKYKPKSQTTVTTRSDQNIRIVGEVVCSRCHQRYREIQMQFDSDFEANKVKKFSTQTQICNVVSDTGTQSRGEEIYDDRIGQQRSPVVTDAAMQVAVELVPTEILMSRWDIENMELEFEDESDGGAYKLRMKSVACPARIKVKPQLVEGSGVHIAKINDSSKIGFSVCSATNGDPKRNGEIANQSDYDAHCELQSSVIFKPPVRTTSLSQGRRSFSKLTQRSLIRLIPAEQGGQKSTSSDTVTQIFSIIKDASVQVGTQLVPQAIGIAPVHLENMEVSVTSRNRRKGEETLSASTLLYPAQVELKGRLMDEQSGIEVVPLDQVEVVYMNSPEVDPLIHYAQPSGNSDATTQIVTLMPESKKSSLLPASLVMETSQLDGHRRVPELASQSLVCEILSSTMKHQALTIEAKSVPKISTEYSGGSSVQQFGYLTVGSVKQTLNLPSQKVLSFDTQCSVGVQNLHLLSLGKQSFSLQATRCPAEITTKTELCEDSGIFICSLDQSEGIAFGISDEPERTFESPGVVGREQSRNKITFVSGRWNSRTNKSMQNAAIKLPVEGVLANSSNLLSNECSLTLQAEAILQPESGSSFNQTDLHHVYDSTSQFRLVVVNASAQSTSKPTIEAGSEPTTPDRQLPTANSTIVNLSRPNVTDHGMQVGVSLVPTSVEIKPIKVENMEAVLTNKTTLSSNEIDVSAILCTSGIQYNEVLAETSGVHVVQIGNGDDISLNYQGDQFATSAILSTKGESVISNIDGSRSWAKSGAISSVFKSSEFVTHLRVKDVQCSAERGLVSGFAQDKVGLNGEVGFMCTRVKTSDKDVQVGLNLVPKAVTVESIRMENFDAVNEGMEVSNTEQISVSAMLCSKPTQYDEILTESRGVTVLPIGAAEGIQIAHDGTMHYATVESRKAFNQKGSYASKHAVIENAYLAGSPTRLRVHYTEFSANGNRQNIACICDNSRSKLMLDGATQVGATFIPTQLKMQQMRLDTQRVQSLAGTLTTKTVFCPTDMSVIPILNECSGVEIAAIKGVSEISIQMAQGRFAAEVLDDSFSNQMCIAIKEESICTSRGLSEESIPLVEPTVCVGHSQETALLDRRTNSNTYEMSSKFVQVGALLIPTAVTMGKVEVNNLEVEVPLSPARSAEISVSAVLASSATELTSVLTNDSGIQVIPMSNVDTIGINVNGERYLGTIDASAFARPTGTFQNSRSIVNSSSTCGQNMQKIVIPMSASNVTSSASSKVEYLLRQSKDLGQLHEALRSVQTRPSLREANSLSVSSYRRPGLLRASEQSVAPVTGSMMTSLILPAVETRDDSVQVGLKLVPQTVEVCAVKAGNDEAALTNARSPELEEVKIHAMLCSSDVQYGQILGESTGVDVVPIRAAKNISIKIDQSRSFATVKSKNNNLQLQRNIDQTQRSMENELGSTPVNTSIGLLSGPNAQFKHAQYSTGHRADGIHQLINGRLTVHTDASTQVGAIVVHQQLSMQKTGLGTGESDISRNLSGSRIESVIYPTQKIASTELCEASGITIADFDGYNNPEYTAKVGSDASIRLVNETTAPCRNKSMTGVSHKPNFENSTSGILETCESSIGSMNKHLVSSASQVGTLLVPAKVCIDRIAVDQLAVDLPLREWRTTDLSVSAILASTATELLPIITDTAGIQIIEMKDLDELGIQVGDEVYVASVVTPPVKHMNATYGPTRNFGVGDKVSNRKQEVVFIPVPRANETANLTHKAKNLLNQSADLRKVHSLLQSSSFQPRLRIMSTGGTSTRLAESTSVQQSMTSRPSECSVYTCPCGLQYAFTDSICRPIAAIGNSNDTRGAMAGTPEPAIEESRIQESYHVACEAAIKPDMLSKRLTANIRTASSDVRSQFNAADPGRVSPSDGTTAVPGAMNICDKPVLQVGTQRAMIHRDFAVSDFSQGKSSKGEYATSPIEYEDSIPQFTHKQANDMVLGTLRGKSEASAICQVQKRTHSADSHTQKQVEQLCVNCQNKLSMAETSMAEPYDPDSIQPAIIIRRSSDVDLSGTSRSTSITRSFILRRGFASGDSGKSLSASFKSFKSQSLTTKCAMCHTDLTSGDLTTSIQTSTSSLLGSDAMVDMSLKEVAEAYGRIYRETGQLDASTESKECASLHQVLKHNRIIQAVIADYERDKNKEGQFFLESKEIADVVAATLKQTSYCTSEPSTYSRLRNNALVKSVVESYETYKHNQGKDNCTQTDPAQLEGVAFDSKDIQEIAEVVGIFEKLEGQVVPKGAFYADLKGNPIIQRVIKEYELNRSEHASTKPSIAKAEATLSSTADSKMGVINVDGHLAQMESEQFASTDSLTRNRSLIIRRKQKSKADEKTISSSVSSDSEDEDIIQNWRSTQRSSLSLEEHTRFDVACSALITPETWDKKVQVDSTHQH